MEKGTKNEPEKIKKKSNNNFSYLWTVEEKDEREGYVAEMVVEFGEHDAAAAAAAVPATPAGPEYWATMIKL